MGVKFFANLTPFFHAICTVRVTSLSHESEWLQIGIGWSMDEHGWHAWLIEFGTKSPKAKNRAELEFYF